jgi:hypothetical protein
LSRELGREIAMAEVEQRAAQHFAALFDAELTLREGAPEL